MNFLTVEKVHKIIELAELTYGSQNSSSIPESKLDTKIFAEVFAEYLNESQNPDAPIHNLSGYICQLDSEELKEAVALMWLGRGAGDEQPSDFLVLAEEAQAMKPQYLLEKSRLAKYLRNGLQKLNLLEINQ